MNLNNPILVGALAVFGVCIFIDLVEKKRTYRKLQQRYGGTMKASGLAFNIGDIGLIATQRRLFSESANGRLRFFLPLPASLFAHSGGRGFLSFHPTYRKCRVKVHFTHNGTKYVLRTDSEAVANAIVNSDEAKQCLAYLIMDSHVNFRLVKSKVLIVAVIIASVSFRNFSS